MTILWTALTASLLGTGFSSSESLEARLTALAKAHHGKVAITVKHLGIGATAKRMEAWGLPNTKIHAKSFRRDTSVFPERTKRFGLGSTTARETVALLEKLHGGQLVSPEACKEMLELLKKCNDDKKFP